MYETTVSVVKENSHLLDYVKSQMEPVLGEVDGICAENDDKFRNSFSLACADTYRFQIRRRLTDAVAQALTLGYKNMYVRSLLHIDRKNFYQNVLVNTICIFDADYDRTVISRLLDMDQSLSIDGYYNFRMDGVKRKWQEITKLISDNCYIMSDSRLIIEFLQYLLESSPSRVKTLSVSIDGDRFVLYDSDNKVLEPALSMAKESLCEEEAMLNILWLKPDKIKVYHSHPLNKSFCKMLNSLFEAEYIEIL